MLSYNLNHTETSLWTAASFVERISLFQVNTKCARQTKHFNDGQKPHQPRSELKLNGVVLSRWTTGNSASGGPSSHCSDSASLLLHPIITVVFHKYARIFHSVELEADVETVRFTVTHPRLVMWPEMRACKTFMLFRKVR